jgi:N-ethylmaleimide reductase
MTLHPSLFSPVDLGDLEAQATGWRAVTRAVRPAGHAYTDVGFAPLVTPRALETDQLLGLIADYVHAAEFAKRAGFDGAEVHAANGYLLEQFLRSKTNLRTDAYGGLMTAKAA